MAGNTHVSAGRSTRCSDAIDVAHPTCFGTIFADDNRDRTTDPTTLKILWVDAAHDPS